MANVNNPRGLVPVGYVGGGVYNGATRQYVHDSGDSSAIGIGDLVTATGAASTINGKVMPNVIRSASGDVFQGVVVSVEPDTRDSTIYVAASTTRILNVADDPNLMFEITEANSGTALTANDSGLNANISAGSVNTTTGYSGMVVDNTTEATTNTLDVKLIQPVMKPNNEVGSVAQKWLVRLNRHRFVNQIAGI